MNYKVSKEYIITILTVFVFLVPGEKYRAIYLIGILALSVLLTGRLNFKKMFEIGYLRWIYAFTFIASYLLHYYRDSFINILFFLVAFFIGRYLIVTGIHTKLQFENIIGFILLIFTLYAILGIVESLTEFNIFDRLLNRTVALYGANEYRGNIYRNHGLCSVSINNGMIMCMVWLLAAYKLFKRFRSKYFIAYIIIGIDVFMIFSRMVILVAIISQIVVILRLKKTVAIKFWLVLLIGIAAIMVLIPDRASNLFIGFTSYFIPLINEFFKGGANGRGIYQGGSGQRFALWGWVIEFVKENIVFGMGFETAFSHSFYDNGVLKIKESVEVHWLYVLLQKGIFGVVGFICFQIHCLLNIIKINKKANERQPNFPFIFLILSVGYFITLFTCAGFEDLQFFYIFFSLYETYIVLAGEFHPGTLSKFNSK